MTVSTGGSGAAPLATYRNGVAYPFCPGCGHHTILDRLDEALVALGADPRRFVLVTDIGCSGLSDQYFALPAFHGLHGRSLTYAAGLKLARPELEVVVILGDGGTGIGGAHLLNAARRNVGLTAIVCNNFNFGMTGGQHSTTTPGGAVTSTTPGGNLERPLDLCATVAANGAAYAWRGTSFDADLVHRMVEAVETPGFALLDVWELCTAFFVPANRASKRTLGEMMDRLGFDRGVICRRRADEYATAYRKAHAAELGTEPSVAPRPLEVRHRSVLDRRFRLVVAGAAGGRVRSSARQLARAAVLSGLWASQRDDYPVTVKTGHSLAQLVLDPEPVDHPAIDRPDALLLLAPEGRKVALPMLARMGAGSVAYVLPELLEGMPEELWLDGTGTGGAGTGAVGASEAEADGAEAGAAAPRIVPLDPADLRAAGARKSHLTLAALAAAALDLGLVPPEALEDAVAHGAPEHAEANLAAVRAGAAWATARR